MQVLAIEQGLSIRCYGDMHTLKSVLTIANPEGQQSCGSQNCEPKDENPATLALATHSRSQSRRSFCCLFYHPTHVILYGVPPNLCMYSVQYPKISDMAYPLAMLASGLAYVFTKSLTSDIALQGTSTCNELVHIYKVLPQGESSDETSHP
jgi:hypothetical protein